MRISSLSFYNATLAGMQSQQSSIARLSQQIATEQKYLAPKDAPIDAAAIMQLSDKIAMRGLYQTNQTRANTVLKEESLVLGQMDKTLTSVQTLLIGAGVEQDRVSREGMAAQLNGFYMQIKDLANHRDAAGNYIFAGAQSDTVPFTHAPTYPAESASSAPTSVIADASFQRMIEVDANREVALNDDITPVMVPPGYDLLQALDTVAAGLLGATPTATQADLDTALAAVSSAIEALRITQVKVGGRINAVADSESTVRAFQLADQNALAKLTELDKSAAIIELQLRQTSLEAAQNSFSMTAKQSLFNYL